MSPLISDLKENTFPAKGFEGFTVTIVGHLLPVCLCAFTWAKYKLSDHQNCCVVGWRSLCSYNRSMQQKAVVKASQQFESYGNLENTLLPTGSYSGFNLSLCVSAAHDYVLITFYYSYQSLIAFFFYMFIHIYV